MKVFLDTNILVDYLNNREPFFAEAAQTIDVCTSGKVEAVVSTLSIINAAYIMRKAYTKESLLFKIAWLIEAFEVSAIERKMIQHAITSRATDFEDAVQYCSALQAGADLIITRDPKGFKDFDLLVMSPSQFIDRCTVGEVK